MPAPTDQITALERKVLDAVSADRLAEDLRWLADGGVRLGGSAAERAAAERVAASARDSGLEVELEPFTAYVSHADDPERFGPASVRAGGDVFAAKAYAFSARAEAPVRGELVDAGTGHPDEYDRRGLDARGRIVLTRLSFDAPHSEPARIAERAGAAGLIVANWSGRDGERIHTGTARSVWGNPTPDDLHRLPAIPVVAVSHATGERLRDAAARRPLSVEVAALSGRSWADAVQPVAELPGQDHRFVLLHGHLDAFGAGMTDNATGVAGLLEVARVLAAVRDELELGVRFAWWTCHEMPYDGSTVYADRHWDELRRGAVTVLNADAWALPDSRDNLQAFAFPELAPAVRAAVRDAAGLELEPGDYGTKDADQSFWGLGTPSGLVISPTPDFPEGPFLGTGFHSEHDGPELVDHAALLQLTRTYALLALRLATATSAPLDAGAAARRLSARLHELARVAPALLGLGELAAEADALARALDGVRTAVGPWDLVPVVAALNGVVYTIGGPYGQDPMAATELRQRLPGLALALAGVDDEDADRRHAWATQLVRERNRVADALASATLHLDALGVAR